MIWLHIISVIILWSPVLLLPIQTPHHPYHHMLPADNAEDWITSWIPPWVTWRATNRNLFFFSSPPLKSKSLRLFTHSLFVLPPHSSPVLPSLFTPLSDSHDWLPVYVRRASSQSAVKAVILLVAIYYPVVCLKKDWKRAKLGACCWVSRHAKLSPQLTYIHLCPSAHESVCMCLCFFCCFFLLSEICRCSLGEVFIYLLIVFLAAQQDLHADIFCCRWGLECAGLQVLKITMQHEAAAYKLWMRSRSANTACCDTRGDFVLNSPSVVSYLCSVLLSSSFPCAHLIFQLQVIKTSSLSWHLLLYGCSKVKTAFENNKNRPCRGLLTSLASASFLLEFTINLLVGENIIRALPEHSSSLQALHEY